MKKVSVIILNWNGVEHELLRRYLPSVVKNTNAEVGEVIVADNGSTDESLKVMAEEFPEVRVIALPENYGFAEGYNQAISQVETEYTLLLNDDVAVTEGWLEPLVKYMDENPEVAAVQPKLLSDRDHSMFEYAGACGGFLDRDGYPYCRGRIFGTTEKDCGQYDEPAEVMWATGAALMVRTKLYREAGGLDKSFFAHMEEIDLCWRLRRMGYRVACVPESVAYHLGGASLNAENPRKTFLNFRNSLLMLQKNTPADKRKGLLRRRKLLDGLAALNFLLHGQMKHVRAIWDAHRAFANANGDDNHSPLPNNHSSLPTPHSPLPTPHSPFPEEQISIIWQYYVLRKKTYKDVMKKA